MSDEVTTHESTRISISLSTLQAELGKLELRLVDRLNSSLNAKADRSVQDQLAQRVSDLFTRVQALESTTVKQESPLAQKVGALDQEMVSLRAVAGYKKWLVVQAIALVGMSVPVLVFVIEAFWRA